MRKESSPTSIRLHTAQIELPVPPERAFSILHTPSAIRGWWGAQRALVVAEPGGVWAAAWGDDEDDPDYLTSAILEVFDPPRRLRLSNYRYVAKSGRLPFEADFTVDFTVEPREHGSLLRVVQDGFPTDPIADEYYAGCEQGWHDTLRSIARFLAGGGSG